MSSRLTYRTRQASPVADAYRRLRGGGVWVDLADCAQIIADAEGHGDAARVLVRELGSDLNAG